MAREGSPSEGEDKHPPNLRAEMDNLKQEDGGKTSHTVDIYRLANWPIPEWLGVKGKMSQLEIGSELKAQAEEYLRKLGYEVAQGAKLAGKSGVEHVFDMLARKDDGFTTNTLAICFAPGGDREVEVGTIFRFANKAYDPAFSAGFLSPSLDSVRRQNS